MKRNYFLLLFIVFGLWGCKEPDLSIITEKTPWGDQVFEVPTFPDEFYNIKDFGAVADPDENNQTAIQQAIDKCHDAGGGTVLLPSGVWRTSYLELKSNVQLRLEKDATLSFIDSIPLYAVPTFTRWEGLECMNYHPFIYARNQENIAITGEGKIIGNGKVWWDLARGTQIQSLTKLYDLVEAGVPSNERNCLAFEPTSYLRPAMVQFISCKKVMIEGIELHSGPMWTNHFVYCEGVIARNLSVITDGPNNDGIVPDASNGVLIDNCFFSTGDDCIVIKSGLNEDGWRVGKASENIVIKNCRTEHGHGGVVIGSEMSGGVRNVYAHDCDFSETQRGLRIKSMKGRGGIIENLWFENIRMDNIKYEAIMINMHYGASSIQPRSDSLPTFRNFHYKDINSSQSRFAIRVEGMDEQSVEGLYLENIHMTSQYGIVMRNTRDAQLVRINSTTEENFPMTLVNVHNIAIDSATFISKNDTMIYVGNDIVQVTLKNVNDEDFQEIYTGKTENPDIILE